MSVTTIRAYQTAANPARGSISRRSRVARWVRVLSIANLLAVVGIWFLIFVVSEQHWLTTALTYLPRSPYLLPAAILLVCAFRWNRKSIWPNLMAAMIVIGPIMELQIPLSTWNQESPVDSNLKIVSCNVQNFHPDFATVLSEISKCNPHIVAFQEARDEHSLLEDYFDGWHSVELAEFWVGSKYPLKVIGQHFNPTIDRMIAITVEVDAPDGKFVLCNLHQTTPRDSLADLRLRSLFDRDDQDAVEMSGLLRNNEAFLTREFVSRTDRSTPLMVVGDFNMPQSSSLYQLHWGEFQNAFDVAGFGYGYTAPCRPHRFWPDGVPWSRIDHILTSSHWQVLHCDTGRLNGSDHRLIAAELRRW